MLTISSEYIKKKIKVRMTTLEVICGIDEKLKELPRNGNSLRETQIIRYPIERRL